jgi:hypothetical protein
VAPLDYYLGFGDSKRSERSGPMAMSSSAADSMRHWPPYAAVKSLDEPTGSPRFFSPHIQAKHTPSFAAMNSSPQA